MKLIGHMLFELESGNHTRTDGQTDVGHINLIGGMVTRNPLKNQSVKPFGEILLTIKNPISPIEDWKQIYKITFY